MSAMTDDKHRDPAELLDRLPLEYADPARWRDAVAPMVAEPSTVLLVFRVDAEWLALPASVIAEVSEMRVWHRLPRRAQRHLLGLVNLRGALTPCTSLGELLGVTSATASSVEASPHALGRARQARLLTLRHGDHLTAFPVSEIYGTIAPSPEAYLNAPATAPGAASGHARSVVRWREHVVGVLDPERLGNAFDRSLA